MYSQKCYRYWKNLFSQLAIRFYQKGVSILQEQDGKTEKPTPKRLQDAKKKGQIPKSQDLSSGISFAVFAFLLTMILTYTLEYAFIFFKNFFSMNLSAIHIENDMSAIGTNAIIYFLILVGPALILAFFTGVIGNLIQVGFVFVTESLKPSFDKMNPVSNLKNIFGKQALFGLLKNLVKLTIIIYITYSAIEEAIYPILNLSSVGTENIFYIVVELARKIGVNISIFLIVLGIADYAYQRYEHTNKLKMSQQEIKDEHKDMEGDPQIKSQRKQRHQEMINGNIQDVSEATVVITNPTHLAIAVRYNQEDNQDEVPIVVVKGADLMAQKMRELARESDVPIIENIPVARNLYQTVEAGQPIPMDMYQAVAEILALIMQLEESRKDKI